jgi:transposase-like protein
MENMSSPSFDSLSHIFMNERTCFEYLISENVLTLERICVCGRNLYYQKARNGFRCPSSDCRRSFSVYSGSFFAKSVLPVNKIMHLAFIWLCKCTVSYAIAYTGHSSKTICAYFGYFRQLISDSLDEVDYCIGGQGIEVELDESKFGKRKYNRGRAVEGVWVLGGVERTRERKVFLVAVPDQSQATLENIISRHVYPGSIILTDLWGGYSGLNTHFGYEHRTVNHSENFVDPETMAHTNTIEGTWAGIKIGLPRRNRIIEGIDEHLFEFIWRRNHHDSLWAGLLDALREVSFD